MMHDVFKKQLELFSKDINTEFSLETNLFSIYMKKNVKPKDQVNNDSKVPSKNFKQNLVIKEKKYVSKIMGKVFYKKNPTPGLIFEEGEILYYVLNYEGLNKIITKEKCVIERVYKKNNSFVNYDETVVNVYLI